MSKITVSITGDGKAIGKTQLFEHLQKCLEGWKPKGAKKPQIRLIDGENAFIFFPNNKEQE